MLKSSWFGAWGLRFGVRSLVFVVWCLVFRLWGSEFGSQGLSVSGLQGFRVSGFRGSGLQGFRVLGFQGVGFMVWRFRVKDLKFEVKGLEFRVKGSGLESLCLGQAPQCDVSSQGYRFRFFCDTFFTKSSMR